jgi:hypothetical protein
MKNLKEAYQKVRQTNQINEEVTRKELAPMLDAFVSFASDKLGLKSLPNIRYKNDEDDYNSFAAYSPSTNELSISTLNRHPMDIFRSVAHELVHHKQNEDGRIGIDVAKEGDTGSDIENEANAEAGKIMRWFAKANPKMFTKTHVVESTNSASIGSGIRGLGNVTGDPKVDDAVVSNYISQNVSDTINMQNDASNLYTNVFDKDWWMNSDDKKAYHTKTAKAVKGKMINLQEGIYDQGKMKAVFLAGGPGSGKDFVMNKVIAGNGLREVNSDTAFEFLMRKNGLDLEMPDEERLERDIVRGRAKSITKEKERLSLAGRLGLIINGTADDVERIKYVKAQLEADGYETMMVFVNTSNEVSRQRNVDRGKGGNRKVPDGTDKFGNPDSSPDIRQQKWDQAQKNIGELQKVFGNNGFVVVDNTSDIRKVSPEEKEKIETAFNRVRRMVGGFVKAENKNPRAAEWEKREASKRGITYTPTRAFAPVKSKQAVPNVIHKPSNDEMEQARRMGLSYYGFGRFGRKVGNKNKVLFVSKGGKLQRVNLQEDLRKWFSKTHPEGDWKRINRKGEVVGPCAREPGEPKPKCMSKKKRSQLSKKERSAAVAAKRKHDPNPERKGQPINVSNFGKGKLTKEETMRYLEEKNVPTNPELWSKAKSLAKSKFDVYPSAYANGWASKWYKSKGGGWKSVNEERGSCWDGYKMEGMKKKGNRTVPNCVPVNEDINENFEDYIKIPSNREIGSNSLAMIYKTMTPGQEPGAEAPDANKRKKLAQEDAGLPKGAFDLASMNDGLGPTFSLRASPALVTGFSQIGSTLAEASASIREWALKEDTQQKFFAKYGDNAVKKLLEACQKLEEAGCGQASASPKSISKLRESFDKGLMDMKPIGTGMYRPHMEVDEDWQDVNRKDKTDGLSQAAVNAYRRENPGSKLQTAVTEKKPTGKRKKRRLSFCRRMKGMKKRLTSAKTARDPDSRINKALRRWNCEE